MPRPAIDITGHRFGRLTVLERISGPSKHPKYLACCDCGAETQVTSYGVRTGGIKSCGCLRRENSAALMSRIDRSANPRTIKGQVRTDTPTYQGMHLRVRRSLGRAADLSCVTCGGTAAEWAYDHLDPHALWGTKNGCRVPYSLDPDHYQPMCVSCHREYDSAQRKKEMV